MLERDSLVNDQNRAIRSFVLRRGRKSEILEQNLIRGWSRFGLSLHERLNAKAVFGRIAPLTVEIGFGNGQALVALARQHPERDFIGIEVYRNGIAQLLGAILHYQLSNIRIYCADAVEVLNNCIADTSLQAVHLFFPDPWPKARHHKRRLVQPGFVDLVGQKLQPQGILHIATDWQDYALQIMHTLTCSTILENTAGINNFSPRPSSRIMTKFEQRGQRLGHAVWDVIFRKP